MYQLKFTATDDADWAHTVQLIDANTNGPLAEAEDATFELEVKDCGDVVLSASSEAGTITKPATNEISWRFTASQMNNLTTRRTYSVGCTMTTESGTIQLFVGTLALIDGGIQ
jgi:hypothetical protein